MAPSFASNVRSLVAVDNREMNYFLKISDGINVAPLVAQLSAKPELWGMQGWRKTLSAHKEMTDIWVRYNAPEKIGKPGFNDEHDPVWYPAYAKLPALKNLIFPLMSIVEGERIGGVLITKIPPGFGIAEHVDASWHVDYYDKFYLSIKSAPGAKFICRDESLEPKAGECWRFDNRLPHSVKNDSDEDRITLIICIRTHKYQVHK